MDLSRRMFLLDDTAAALRMIRRELATVEAEAVVRALVGDSREALSPEHPDEGHARVA